MAGTLYDGLMGTGEGHNPRRRGTFRERKGGRSGREAMALNRQARAQAPQPSHRDTSQGEARQYARAPPENTPSAKKDCSSAPPHRNLRGTTEPCRSRARARLAATVVFSGSPLAGRQWQFSRGKPTNAPGSCWERWKRCTSPLECSATPPGTEPLQS